MTPPVSAEAIHAGPVPKRIRHATTAATTRTATEVRDPARTAASPPGRRDHAGRATTTNADRVAETQTITTTITRRESPRRASVQSVRMPSPMLTPSAVR